MLKEVRKQIKIRNSFCVNYCKTLTIRFVKASRNVLRLIHHGNSDGGNRTGIDRNDMKYCEIYLLINYAIQRYFTTFMHH